MSGGISAVATCTWVAPSGATGTFTMTAGSTGTVAVGSRLTFALQTPTGVDSWSVCFESDNFSLDNRQLQGTGAQSLTWTLPLAPSTITIEVQAAGVNGGRDVITSFITETTGAPTAGKNVVRVRNGGGAGMVASPYSANPFDVCEAVTDAGDVVINFATLAKNQWATVRHDSYTSLASANVNVVAPAGVKMAQPVPNNANSYVSSQTFTGNTSAGFSLTWTNTGSTGGYNLG